MLAIEDSQKLTLSNLSSLNLFTGTDQGQFEVMKSQVLKQIGYDSADLNFAYFDMKEVAYKEVVFGGGKEVGYEIRGKNASPLSGFACTIACVCYEDCRDSDPFGAKRAGGSVRWRGRRKWQGWATSNSS